MKPARVVIGVDPLPEAALDLDTGDQPIWNERRTICVVCNGEIYNYVELRAELERQGRSFRTTSDTEVLAQVLAQSGPQGLARCEGMWGLAWFDPKTDRLDGTYSQKALNQKFDVTFLRAR